MTIVSRLRREYGHAEIKNCCEKTGITIDKDENLVIFKGELLPPQPGKQKMCDCVIFREDKKVVIAELKSRTSNGHNLLEKFVNTCEKFRFMIVPMKPSDFDIYLVLVARKHTQSTYRMLLGSPVRVNGKKHWIVPKADRIRLCDIVR